MIDTPRTLAEATALANHYRRALQAIRQDAEEAKRLNLLIATGPLAEYANHALVHPETVP